jgi:hypothetical protein
LLDDTTSPCSSLLLTVYALLVSKGLTLLCLIPVQDQAIPKGKGGSSISGGLITVEEGSRKGRLDMADGVSGKVVGRREGLGHLLLH